MIPTQTQQHPQQQSSQMMMNPQMHQQQTVVDSPNNANISTSGDGISNQLFNENMYQILRLQINSYKMFLRNEQVPQKLLEHLKTRLPQQQQQQHQVVTAVPQYNQQYTNGRPQHQQNQVVYPQQQQQQQQQQQTSHQIIQNGQLVT
jgi:hypothetical protein